ncbi:hypothetical protein [Bradyrhizobium sp. 174]|uniref:hypothetical protein n=1 Tax=Bradyrhizobium sp. 174 TaxID=2782645 RepID=UPI001FF95A50|nr:hypothetical protein [Bradyrhizobium sp. 174]MCK1573578.1 hypothetical protein [Bradyrhizobium sp. 174]
MLWMLRARSSSLAGMLASVQLLSFLHYKRARAGRDVASVVRRFFVLIDEMREGLRSNLGIGWTS